MNERDLAEVMAKAAYAMLTLRDAIDATLTYWRATLADLGECEDGGHRAGR